MKCFFIFLILQSSFVFAEKTISKKDFSQLGKIDEKDLKENDSIKPIFVTATSDSKFSISCKDTAGKEFKKGENGYDTCLAGIKNRHDMNKLDSGLNKKNNKDGNTATFNFKIGD